MVFPGMAGDLPPLVTAAVVLGRTGTEIEMEVAGCEPATLRQLEGSGVTCRSLGARRYPRSLVGKALLRLRYARLLRSAVRESPPEVIWYHTAHGMRYRRWLRRLAPGAVEVAHAHELYPPHSRPHAIQERAVRDASCWIAPESGRGEVLAKSTGSRAPGFIVPNRPLATLAPPPLRDGLAGALFREHGGSRRCTRFVIYQGWMAEDRCIIEAVEGFRLLGRPEVGLILLGECRVPSFARRIRRAAAGDSRVVVADKIPPPDHLRVTAGCEVGLMLYAPTGLNNLLCAPNKIYEYAWCGLGVVMPALPHLRALCEEHGFGRTCDPGDATAIAAAVGAELDRDPVQRMLAAAAFLEVSPSPVHTYGEIHAFLSRSIAATGRAE